MTRPLGRRAGGRAGSQARAGARSETPVRTARYRNLTNSLLRQPAFPDDRVQAIHDTALRVLQDLGIKVLNGEARALFKKAGALVDDETLMVRIGRDLVERSLETAPSAFVMEGGEPERAVQLGGDNVAFVCVGGPPFVTDIDRGKRPGTLADTRNIVRLSQHFDVIHLQSPNVEPQDVDLKVRHLHATECQITLSDKPPFIFSRGAPQVRDCFEMMRIVRGLSEDEFQAKPWCYTVINTNSPRQLDVPMCQGIMDFARAGQVSVITPFTLAGAMAPITISGALTLQHAEALAGIALAQIARTGAPVVYGSFTSNVDMKSGAPAFGTPEFVKGAFGAGQLARHIGLPWRGSAATASNAPDEQAVYEFLISAWGSLLGGVNMMVHAAGWLEGGLTASMEKYILDIEMLQIFAEIFQPLEAGAEEIGYEALAEVEPGGHFFAAAHTMSRYQDAFYTPLVADWRNFETWQRDGAKTATQRANDIWKKTLAEFQPPPLAPGRGEALQAFIERRTREGGAPPES